MYMYVANVYCNGFIPFLRLIRDSAPHINTIVIVGCLVMLLGCYLLGIDSNNPPQEGDNDYVHQQNDTVPMGVLLARNHRYKVICTVRNDYIIVVYARGRLWL